MHDFEAFRADSSDFTRVKPANATSPSGGRSTILSTSAPVPGGLLVSSWTPGEVVATFRGGAGVGLTVLRRAVSRRSGAEKSERGPAHSREPSRLEECGLCVLQSKLQPEACPGQTKQSGIDGR
jgi:hypothetical protein